MKQRIELRRNDDDARRGAVETARDIIYNKNYAVDNGHVEMLLKEQSLVPTAVSVKLIWYTGSH